MEGGGVNMSSSVKQKENYEFFQKELKGLLSNPAIAGKYAIIYNMAIDSVFDTFEMAYHEACSRSLVDFIIQQIIDERKINNYVSPAIAL